MPIESLETKTKPIFPNDFTSTLEGLRKPLRQSINYLLKALRKVITVINMEQLNMGLSKET